MYQKVAVCANLIRFDLEIITERRTLMNQYYVGLDVHKASICIAVLNADGKLVMESVVETSAATILDFLKALRGNVKVTFEGVSRLPR